MTGRARRALGALLLLIASPLVAGPVEVYREGPRFCPRDRASDAPALTEAQAIERARTMLPADFCGPSWAVSGCDTLTEFRAGELAHLLPSVQAARRHARPRRPDPHYVILDRVGNCYANIPGTEFGAGR
jgi:hypothetical protein